MSVDRARDAVVHLGVQLGKDVSVMDARLLNVPDGRLLHDVPHLEPLDGLVLGAALGAVGAADVLDMAAAVLVAAAVAVTKQYLPSYKNKENKHYLLTCVIYRPL